MSSLVSSPPDTVRVLVVDDHVQFAQMLCQAISSEPGFDCLGPVHNATDAYRLAAEVRPHVVIMDLQMPGIDGIAATAHLTALYPDLLVVFLTAHAVNGRMDEARRSGAAGLIMKDGSLATVLGAIHGARRGAFEIFPAVA
jgi:DNA-binding NarL/FixJ family response regulator